MNLLPHPARVVFLLAIFAKGVCASAAEWQTAPVPGQRSFSGFVWYRAWLKPHKTFFSRHERDLWGESTVLNIRGLRGAHEVFVNGKRIGTGGGFPPNYRDGAEGNHRHKVPPGTLVKDRWNPIAIRV